MKSRVKSSRLGDLCIPSHKKEEKNKISTGIVKTTPHLTTHRRSKTELTSSEALLANLTNRIYLSFNYTYTSNIT